MFENGLFRWRNFICTYRLRYIPHVKYGSRVIWFLHTCILMILCYPFVDRQPPFPCKFLPDMTRFRSVMLNPNQDHHCMWLMHGPLESKMSTTAFHVMGVSIAAHTGMKIQSPVR